MSEQSPSAKLGRKTKKNVLSVVGFHSFNFRAWCQFFEQTHRFILSKVTHWACCPFLCWWRWGCGCRGGDTKAPTPAAALGKTCKGGCCTSACESLPCAARNQPRNAQRGAGGAACHLQAGRRQGGFNVWPRGKRGDRKYDNVTLLMFKYTSWRIWRMTVCKAGLQSVSLDLKNICY